MKARLLFLIFLLSCASYERFKHLAEERKMPTRVVNAPYHQTWQAVLQVMQRYNLELQDQRAGVIKTQWIENTTELNFVDSFGSNDAVRAAKFKITLNIVKGFRNSREVSKISLYKRQLIEQDFLQGWKEIPSDGIQETTLLYRIVRVLLIDNKLRAIEKEREEAELKNF